MRIGETLLMINDEEMVLKTADATPVGAEMPAPSERRYEKDTR